MFRRSVLAGIFIGLGGLVSLATGGGIIGAVFYIFSFLCIIYTDSLLYTAKAGWIGLEGIGWKEIGIILLGNIFGVFLISLLARAGGVGVDSAASISGRLDIPFFRVFMRGLGCGLIIDMVLWLWRDKQTLIPIFFGVPLFILASQEHSISLGFDILAAGILSWRVLLSWLLVILGNFIGCNIRRLFIPSKKR